MKIYLELFVDKPTLYLSEDGLKPSARKRLQGADAAAIFPHQVLGTGWRELGIDPHKVPVVVLPDGEFMDKVYGEEGMP